jgi:glycosyltransferase 2 family protein
MKILQIVIGAAIGLLALYIAFHGVNLAAAARAAEQANPLWLAFSFILVSLSILLRSMRWQALFTNTRGLHLGNVFGVLNVGYFVNTITPRVGEIVRAVLLGQVEPVSRVEAFSTIVVERVADLLAVIVLLFASMEAVHFSSEALRSAGKFGAVFAGLLLAVMMLAVMKRKATLGCVSWAIHPLPERWRHGIMDKAESVLAGMGALKDPGAAAKVIGFTILIYLVNVAAMEAQLVAFHMQFTPAVPFFLIGAASLGLIIPVPGGIGVWEASIVFVLTSLLGIDRNQAAGLAVVSHLIFFAPPMIFAALYLWRLGASWETVFGMSRSKSQATVMVEPSPQMD